MLNKKFMDDLINRAHQIQQSLEKEQHEIKRFEVTGRSLCNRVTVAMDGCYISKCVEISPQIMNNKPALEKAFMESINDATKKIEVQILAKIKAIG